MSRKIKVSLRLRSNTSGALGLPRGLDSRRCQSYALRTGRYPAVDLDSGLGGYPLWPGQVNRPRLLYRIEMLGKATLMRNETTPRSRPLPA